MRRVLVLLLLVALGAWSAWSVPAAASSSGSAPAGDVRAERAAQRTIVVPVEIRTWTEHTDNYRCNLTAAIRWQELKGWEAADYTLYSGTVKTVRVITPPYDDHQQEASLAPLAAGQHRSVLASYGASVNSSPYKECTEDLVAKQAEYLALYGTEVRLRMVPTAKCESAMTSLKSAKKSLKTAKKKLRNATTQPEKDLYRQQVKIFKAKKKKAQKKVKRHC